MLLFGISSISLADSLTEDFIAPGTPTEESENVVILNDPMLLDKNNFLSPNSVEPNAIGISLKNRKLIGQRYYGDRPFLVDSVQGPMSKGPSIEFKTKISGGYDGKFGVSAGNIKSSFGVNVNYETTLTRKYQFDPIPKGKTLTYKAYVNYSLYEFDVYSFGVYKGKGKYWVPVGIVIKHGVR